MPTRIETERLILRTLVPSDAEATCALEGDAEVKRFLRGAREYDVEKARRDIEAGKFEFLMAVTLAASGEFIGRCGLTESDGEWEINIVLQKQHWRSGFGLEIGKSLIQYGFLELGADRILGIADTENSASHHLCKRLGMKLAENVQMKNQRVFEIWRE